MEELDFFFMALYIAKSFYDYGKLDKLIGNIGEDYILTQDSYYELCQICLPAICESIYINEKEDECQYITTCIYFSDTCMVDYYRLCEEYGVLHHLNESNNPFIEKAEKQMAYSLNFGSYSYGYAIMTKTNKKRSSGILIEYDDEFFNFCEMIVGLLDAFYFYQQESSALRELLNKERAQLPALSQNPLKEAA